jgi:uncharacterized protein YdhG (YjbR/CyaY superfamily)
MAKTDFRSVDEYIATQPKEVQVALQRVRGIIRKAVPTAVEVISYQIAAFKVAKRPFLWLAAWKEHYSLYPASEALVAAFKGALTPYRASKGTLRFPLTEPVPGKLIERIAKFKAKEAARRAKAKPALRKKGRRARVDNPSSIKRNPNR